MGVMSVCRLLAYEIIRYITASTNVCSDSLVSTVNFIAKNRRIVSYSEKYLSRRFCGDRADGRVDVEHTNS